MDLASRYLTLLANQTASHAFTNHNGSVPTVVDVRMALQDVGAFAPQIGSFEEQSIGEEDSRGMESFLKWLAGDESKEIRRIAGMLGIEGEVDVEAGNEREDFLTGKLSQQLLLFLQIADWQFIKPLRRSIVRRVKSPDFRAQSWGKVQTSGRYV